MGYVSTKEFSVAEKYLSGLKLDIVRALIKETISFQNEDWSLAIHLDSRGDVRDISIVLRYPEFVISNSKDESHTIRDLYIVVHFSFSSSPFRLILEDVTGFRGCVTYEEFSSCYVHSHLTSIPPYQIEDCWDDGSESPLGKSFCLGSGEINTLMADFNGIDSKDYTNVEKLSELWIPILIQLDTVATWESIEGVPHQNIRDISTKFKSSASDFYLSPNELKNRYEKYFLLTNSVGISKVLEIFKQLVTVDQLRNITYLEDQVILVDRGLLQSLLIDLYIKDKNAVEEVMGGDGWLEILYVQKIGSKYAEISGVVSENSLYEVPENLTFLFRDEEKTFTVIDLPQTESTEVIKENIIINPYILPFLCAMLNKILNETKISKDTIDPITLAC